MTDLPAAHGILYDPFTKDLILSGSTHVTQIDPDAPSVIKSDLDRSGDSVNFDQGTVDGAGHFFVADNRGKLLFVDYADTGLIGAASNFLTVQFFESNLDDIALRAGAADYRHHHDDQGHHRRAGQEAEPHRCGRRALGRYSGAFGWIRFRACSSRPAAHSVAVTREGHQPARRSMSTSPSHRQVARCATEWRRSDSNRRLLACKARSEGRPTRSRTLKVLSAAVSVDRHDAWFTCVSSHLGHAEGTKLPCSHPRR